MKAVVTDQSININPSWFYSKTNKQGQSLILGKQNGYFIIFWHLYDVHIDDWIYKPIIWLPTVKSINEALVIFNKKIVELGV